MAPAYPSSTNVFIWDQTASGGMVVDYSRNPKDYPVNGYVQIQPAKKPAGKYLRVTREVAGRIRSSGADEFIWYDGDPAPEGLENLESFAWQNFFCVRRAFPFRIGNITAEAAGWDIVQQHAGIMAQLAMATRTQLVYNALTTTANWDASHIVDVTNNAVIPGVSGNWAESLTSRKDIQRSISWGIEKVLADTLNGVTNPEENMMLTISSEAARRLAVSQEIVDYIKGSPDALAQVRGELPGGNVRHNLPGKLFGVGLKVEDTYKVTTRKGSNTQTRSQIWSPSYAFLTSRPGGLVGIAGAPSFSTMVWLAYKEMEVWKKDDKDNERTLGRVVDFGVAAVVAPTSGIWFQNIT
jgi:hypothetical protein